MVLRRSAEDFCQNLLIHVILAEPPSLPHGGPASQRRPIYFPKILQATEVSVLPSITRVLGRQTMLREVLGQLEELIPSGYNL